MRAQAQLCQRPLPASTRRWMRSTNTLGDVRARRDHLLHLVRLRASQINGCAYCIDMHWKDLRALGEGEQRLYSLDAWSECSVLHASASGPRSHGPKPSR